MTGEPALLTYTVTPTVVPCGTGEDDTTVTLLAVATNAGTVPLDVASIAYTIPVGTGAGDLTGNPGALVATVVGSGWSVAGDGQGTFTLVPQPATPLAPDARVGLLVSEVQVSTVPGLVEIAVTEQADASRSAVLGVVKVPPGLAVTSFTADPLTVAAGATSLLSWTTTGAETCALSWSGSSVQVETEGEFGVQPDRTTTYVLTASSEDGSVSQQLTVMVTS